MAATSSARHESPVQAPRSRRESRRDHRRNERNRRSTSLAFARAGAHLVLAARRADALEQVARDCENFGVRTLVVPTDVSIVDQVERLANIAVERFGHIDVWVNNAAVLMMGRFEDLPRMRFDESGKRISLDAYTAPAPRYGASALRTSASWSMSTRCSAGSCNPTQAHILRANSRFVGSFKAFH